MARTKTIRKGERKKVIDNFGTGIPRTFHVSIRPLDDGEEVSGTFEEKRHFWIFPDTVNRGEITREMEFHRRWINAIYVLTLTPNCDVEVTIR